MKAPRNILKTIRITDELYKHISEFEGSTFNDKINNLLEFYISKNLSYRKYLKDLESQIQLKEQLLDEFKLKISKFQDLLK